MTKTQVSNAISLLKNSQGVRYSKYTRNYRRYTATPNISLSSIRSNQVVGYYTEDFTNEEDTTSTPSENIIKSCIDTLTSKIAQSKVRPFFNCVNGDFKEIQTVKQAQQFFDNLYEMQDVNKTVSDAFRDCCIFDTGVVYIDEKTATIRKALPWQVFFDPAEMTYNKLTRVYYEQKEYPATLLPEGIKTKTGCDYVTFGLYYDIKNNCKAVYIPEFSLLQIESFESDRLPFVFLHYSNPISGSSSNSIVDVLNTIQIEINILMSKISDASQLNPANTIMVPEGSTVKASALNNRIGNILTYRPVPNGSGSPVTVATPAFIDSQYTTLLEQLKQDAYEMVGISQLSAQSQKPTGLDSGVALQTMENIESDRFETQLNQVVRAYVEIAKACISCFDKNVNILPEDNQRLSIKWADIVNQSKNMSIQFSGADALSKDPSTKLQQLQMLAQAGIIPTSRISQFMEIPDLQGGYSLSNNAINAVMAVIDECIENDNYDVPEYIPFTILKEEIINTQLSLKGAKSEKNEIDIEKLSKLYEIVEQLEENWALETQNEMLMQQGQQTESGLPVQQNVLTQEANAVPVEEIEQTDLDVQTQQGNNAIGQWNGQVGGY